MALIIITVRARRSASRAWLLLLTYVLLGSAPLESAKFETDLPLLGHIKVTSALPFDIGVYLLVLGLVLMVFESFGDDPQTVMAPIDVDEDHELAVAADADTEPAVEVPTR